MKKSIQKNDITPPRWAIQFCAIAAISSLAVAGIFSDKKVTKAVATSASAVFWGLGSGMAFNRLINRERN